MAEQAKANETKVVFSLTEDSNMFKAIGLVADKAQRYRNEIHSVQYWTEFLLAKGISTHLNYLDNDKERRDKDAYVAEMNRLVAPPPLDMNDPKSVQANVAYAQATQSLRRKYGQGGEQKQL